MPNVSYIAVNCNQISYITPFLSVDVMMSGISGSNPPFTLTCVSTNLPPTTVEWTLNGKKYNNFTTILNNPETTQYTHTLTVSERIGGNYTCSIFAFNESSVSSAFGLDYFNVYGMCLYVLYHDLFSAAV